MARKRRNVNKLRRTGTVTVIVSVSVTAAVAIPLSVTVGIFIRREESDVCGTWNPRQSHKWSTLGATHRNHDDSDRNCL
jgi:hypothetical protein